MTINVKYNMSNRYSDKHDKKVINRRYLISGEMHATNKKVAKKINL